MLRVAVFGALFVGVSAAVAADRPNIVLVVVDDLPADMCNFLGAVRPPNPTPCLDRLATEGVVLRNLHSPSPICTPSRFAILSGRYPSTSQASELTEISDEYGQTFVSFNTFLSAADVTIPRVLQRSGYRTGAVGKNHVFEVPGYVHVPYESDPARPEISRRLRRNAKRLEQAYHAAGFEYAKSLYHGNPDADGVRKLAVHNQDWVTEGAVRFLEQSDERPFFLYMATTLTHGPFEASRSWKSDRRTTPVGRLREAPRVQPDADSIASRLSAAGEERWNRGALVWLDDALGRVVTELEANGHLESTIIVVLSDHGTKSKGSLFDAGTRTPGVVWRKGGFGAGGIESALSLVDIMPTLLELAGAETRASSEPRLAGRSFARQLSGADGWSDRVLYFELGFTRAIYDGRYKYLAIRHPDPIAHMSREERRRRLAANTERLALRGRPIPTDDPMAPFSHLSPIPGGNDAEQVSIGRYPAYFEADQLYDLSVDPHEQRNLAGDPRYTAQLNRMKQLLVAQVDALPGSFPVGDASEAVEGTRESPVRANMPRSESGGSQRRRASSLPRSGSTVIDRDANDAGAA